MEHTLVSPLAATPTLKSQFRSVTGRPAYTCAVAGRVREYFRERWPCISEEAKECYCNQDIEEWAVLVCPSASEDRAESAAAFVTFFFCFDDLIETMTHDEVSLNPASQPSTP